MKTLDGTPLRIGGKNGMSAVDHYLTDNEKESLLPNMITLKLLSQSTPASPKNMMTEITKSTAEIVRNVERVDRTVVHSFLP